MWRKLQALRPSGRVWKKTMMALFVFGVGLLAFCWGRHGALSDAHAANPPTDPVLQDNVVPANSDYGKRVVAFVYNNVPVSREELGEYLIARFGEQRLEFLVNHKIIQMACRAQNIVITDAEVEKELMENVKSFQAVSVKQFVNQVLGRYGKTLYEWKEDVIRPKLALRRLAAPRVKVTEEDVRNAFESHYGKKKECRMILFAPKTDKNYVSKVRAECKDPAKFTNYASQQYMKHLADKSGLLPSPIYKHFPDQNVEREAFSLQPGQISGMIELPDESIALLRCEKDIPEDTTRIYEQERVKLLAEVQEMKLQQEIPKMFEEMRKNAAPRLFLGHNRENLTQQVERELQQTSGEYAPRPVPPGATPQK